MVITEGCGSECGSIVETAPCLLQILTVLSLQLPSLMQEEVVEQKVRLPSKPVVIGDALPVPAECPDSVEQLLEASLAHHNLGRPNWSAASLL